MKNYDYKLTDVFTDATGNLRFTLTFLDEGKLVDKTDEKELAAYGWTSFLWKKGIALSQGSYWQEDDSDGGEKEVGVVARFHSTWLLLPLPETHSGTFNLLGGERGGRG